jgi:predicted short-subunit dehydrogenase-like oxidoreductase (DUF2520 family)
MSPRRSQKSVKPTVSVVGVGRLGTALSLALTSSGYQVLAVVARRATQASAVARLLGNATVPLNAKQLTRLPTSDLILIATPDDAIEMTARSLSASLAQPGAATVLHTSGALSSAVLAPLATAGFHTGSIHPLVSVSDPRRGAESLRGAFYGVEGDSAALKIARRVVRDLEGHSFSIDTDKKALYHAAAVMSSGHVTALFDVATEMLIECGLTQMLARRVLLPLLQSAVTNLERSSPEAALTGTFARGDVATVSEHLKALRLEKDQVPLELYRLLGERSIKIAAKRLDTNRQKQLARALKRMPEE